MASHCTSCGAEIEGQNRFCTSCGTPVEEAAVDASTAQPPTSVFPAAPAVDAAVPAPPIGRGTDPGATTFVSGPPDPLSVPCATCGAALQSSDGFCTTCGTPATQPPTPYQVPAQPQASSPPAEVGPMAFGTDFPPQQGFGATNPPQPAQQDFTAAMPVEQLPSADSGSWPGERSATNPPPINLDVIESPTPATKTRRWPKRLGLGLLAIVVLGGAGAAALTYFTDTDLRSLLSGDESSTAAATTADDAESASDGSSTVPATDTTAPAEAETTTTTVAPTTTSTTTTTTIPTTVDAVVPGVQCSSTGQALRGTITGVEDWVTMRAGPGISTLDLDQVPWRSEVAYFPESIRQGDRFEWIEISYSGNCGWVASKFVNNVGGRVVGKVNGADYVHRALRGLEPEALYASFTFVDPQSPNETIPFDPDSLADVTDALRRFYLENGSEIDVTPDLSFGDDPDLGEGCVFSHFFHCGIFLVDDNGNQVGQVEVSYVGDGLTTARLILQ